MNETRETLRQLWEFIKWKLTGSKASLCCVCGDDLHDETEILHAHCTACWPTYLRNGAPPIVHESPRPLGMRQGGGR